MSLKDLQERKEMLECELRNVERSIKDALPERHGKMWTCEEDKDLTARFEYFLSTEAHDHERRSGAILERLRRLFPAMNPYIDNFPRATMWPPPNTANEGCTPKNYSKETFEEGEFRRALNDLIRSRSRRYGKKDSHMRSIAIRMLKESC